MSGSRSLRRSLRGALAAALPHICQVGGGRSHSFWQQRARGAEAFGRLRGMGCWISYWFHLFSLDFIGYIGFIRCFISSRGLQGDGRLAQEATVAHRHVRGGSRSKCPCHGPEGPHSASQGRDYPLPLQDDQEHQQAWGAGWAWRS